MLPDDIIETIDQYCARLGRALHKAPSFERDEIVEEVRSHILERLEAEAEVSQRTVSDILQAVGDPGELASEYRTQAMLRHAVHSRSPWVLLRATLAWASRGIAGLVAFFATVAGYSCTAVFLLCALLKPLFPSRVGLWLAPQHTLSFGYWNGRLSGAQIYGLSMRPPFDFVLVGTLGPMNGPVHELLGAWLVPIGAFCGTLFFLVTTIFVRWWIAKFVRPAGQIRAASKHKPVPMSMG